jgi:hypothetical protein
MTDLSSTCFGAYYLKDLTNIQEKYKFELFQAQEYAFQITSNQWIISSPINFPTTGKCPTTFTSITVRSSYSSTLTPGCNVNLKSNQVPQISTLIWKQSTRNRHGIQMCYFHLTTLKSLKLQLHI